MVDEQEVLRQRFETARLTLGEVQVAKRKPQLPPLSDDEIAVRLTQLQTEFNRVSAHDRELSGRRGELDSRAGLLEADAFALPEREESRLAKESEARILRREIVALDQERDVQGLGLGQSAAMRRFEKELLDFYVEIGELEAPPSPGVMDRLRGVPLIGELTLALEGVGQLVSAGRFPLDAPGSLDVLQGMYDQFVKGAVLGQDLPPAANDDELRGRLISGFLGALQPEETEILLSQPLFGSIISLPPGVQVSAGRMAAGQVRREILADKAIAEGILNNADGLLAVLKDQRGSLGRKVTQSEAQLAAIGDDVAGKPPWTVLDEDLLVRTRSELQDAADNVTFVEGRGHLLDDATALTDFKRFADEAGETVRGLEARKVLAAAGGPEAIASSRTRILEAKKALGTLDGHIAKQEQAIERLRTVTEKPSKTPKTTVPAAAAPKKAVPKKARTPKPQEVPVDVARAAQAAYVNDAPNLATATVKSVKKPKAQLTPTEADTAARSAVGKLTAAIRKGNPAEIAEAVRVSKAADKAKAKARQRAKDKPPAEPTENSPSGRSPEGPDGPHDILPDPPSGVGPVEPLGSKSNFRRTLAEVFSDRYDGINGVSTRANADYKRITGVALPPDLNAEVMLSLYGGAPSAGITRARLAWNQIRRHLGKDIPDAELDRFLMARHSLEVFKQLPKRKAVGKVSTPEHARAILDDLTERLGPERSARLEAAAEVVRETYADILVRKVEAGLVSVELAHILRNRYPWYNPIRYVESVVVQGADPVVIPTGARNRMLARTSIKRLGDHGVAGATERPLDLFGREIVKAEALISRNKALRAVAHNFDLFDAPPPKGSKTKSFSWMEEGERVTREAPDWMVNELKGLDLLGYSEMERWLRVMNSVSRKGFTTLSLPFFARNFAVDSLTAMLTQGVGPVAITRRLLKNFAALVREDPILNAKSLAGGDVSGFFGRTEKEIIGHVNAKGNIAVTAGQGMTREARALFDPRQLATTIERIGHAVEEAPRAAIFERKLKAGLTIEDAAFASRRGTLDFGRSGRAVGSANAAILYLNAAVQGFLQPFRGLGFIGRDPSINQGAMRLRLAGFGAFVTGLYAWNRQFPEFDDVPAWVKYQSLIIMVPSEEYSRDGRRLPHYISVVPTQREWAMFSGPLTYMYRKLDSENPEDFGQFLDAWLDNVSPLGRVTGESGLPLPQPVSVGIQLARNDDIFRGRQIVPDELKYLPLDKQVLSTTSEFARRVGPLIGVSPLKLDFFVKNLTGTVGSQVVDVIDKALLEVPALQPDAELLETAERLRSIKAPAVPPTEVAVRRSEFLATLDPLVRDEVIQLAERLERGVDFPVIDPIARSFFPQRGGQLKKTAEARIANSLGISAEQTREVARQVSQLRHSVAQKTAEAEADWAIINDEGYTGAAYRETYSNASIAARILLASLQVQFPGAAQVQDDPTLFGQFIGQTNSILAILGGDQRGEMLEAVWFSFQPEETGTPGEIDFRPLRLREEWWNQLAGEDQAILDRQLKASLSEVRQQFWDDQRLLAEYWEIPDRLMENEPELLDAYYTYLKRDPVAQGKLRARNPRLAARLKTIDQRRIDMRLRRQDIDDALTLWYDHVPIRSQARFAPKSISDLVETPKATFTPRSSRRRRSQPPLPSLGGDFR